jgi:Ca2+-binding EF-hand superfamily protein
MRLLIQWTAAATLALATAACHSGNATGPGEPTSPARAEYIAEFKKIDRAGKGRITMEEATAYYEARFNELDTNGDGRLDEQELEPLIPIMNAKSARELLVRLDRDSDNTVSRAEFLVIANWLFQLARDPRELTLADVERNAPPAAGSTPRKDRSASPGKGR